MGKFKKAMKAIGSGLVVVAEVVDRAMTPQYWYEQAAIAAKRGNHALARDYAMRGIDAERQRSRYRY